MTTVDSGSIPNWMAEEYPFSPRSFLTPAGARMSYVDEGPRSDEAVLMLHGNPTWSFYYRHLVRELSRSMRCIVPDHIGMGASDKPARYDYTLTRRIADVEALVLSLNLKRVHLIVHDWGGAIGFGFALQFIGLAASGLHWTGRFRATFFVARIDR
jgi:cis-3-alkyl-4-acyloxetan-2-one decarboxylase